MNDKNKKIVVILVSVATTVCVALALLWLRQPDFIESLQRAEPSQLVILSVDYVSATDASDEKSELSDEKREQVLDFLRKTSFKKVGGFGGEGDISGTKFIHMTIKYKDRIGYISLSPDGNLHCKWDGEGKGQRYLAGDAGLFQKILAITA